VNRPRHLPFRPLVLALAWSSRLAAAADGTAAAAAGADANLAARVRRNEAGDVWIAGVPMVHQGNGGFCVPAVAERVLRHFGKPADREAIAAASRTGELGGTHSDDLLAGLIRICRANGLAVETLMGWTPEGFRAFLADYNRAAAAVGAPRIEPAAVDPADVGPVYGRMDPRALRAATGADARGLEEFRRHIRESVEAGLPPIWSVYVGLYPERPALAAYQRGGHLRLVIGYNDRAAEVLYTDTWGPGHELKRLPLADAWAMSLALTRVAPAGKTPPNDGRWP
jgi:hypothetical protein